MRTLPFVPIIAIVFCGLIAGVQLGDRLGPTYARRALTPSGFITPQQICHLRYAKVLPVFLLCSLLGALVWLARIRAQRHHIYFWYLAFVLTAIAGAIFLTIRINFPINDQLMTWSAARPPANFRQIWSTWETAHTARTILWVAALVLEVASLSFGVPRKD